MADDTVGRAAPPDDTAQVDTHAGRTTVAATSAPRHLLRVGQRAGLSADAVLAVIAVLLVGAVHSVSYVLRTPYWLDESWVVVAVRGPLHDLRLTTSSTPVLWTSLLRLDFYNGGQRLRLIPLAFAGLAAAAGFALLRILNFPRLVAFGLGAGAVLFCPAMLIRNDLKQYTADAFFGLLLLVFLSRVDAEWARRRVVALGIVCAIAPGFSNAAIYTATASLVAAGATIILTRKWSRWRDLAIAVVIAAVGYVLWIGLFALPNDIPSLKNYWIADYPSPHHLLSYFKLRELSVKGALGVHNKWLLLILNALGLGTLVLRGRTATALMLPLAFAGNLIAGMLKLSPFLDERTSTWLFACDDVLMAIGVAGVACWLLERALRSPQTVFVAGSAVLCAAVCVGAALAFTLPDKQIRDKHTITPDGVARLTNYVDAHKGPHDVVVVDFRASYSYAYYSHEQVIPVRNKLPANGFLVSYPASDRVIDTPPVGSDYVATAMSQAAALIAPYPGARIWVIRYSVPTAEQAQWATVTPTYGLVEEMRGDLASLLVGETTS